jgi:hypothetical protein
MSNTNTGGPAFPQTDRVVGALSIANSQGMTLRDYFAAKAMQGLLSNPKLHAHILKQGGAFGGWIESSAYGWADAMLDERESKDKNVNVSVKKRITRSIEAKLKAREA